MGLLEADLIGIYSCRFKVSKSAVSMIFITWANYLYVLLGIIPIWPSRSKVDKLMPQSFKSLYSKTRVTLDCTELKVQKPIASSKVLNSQLFSNYKSHTTLKGLIGISPHGSALWAFFTLVQFLTKK